MGKWVDENDIGNSIPPLQEGESQSSDAGFENERFGNFRFDRIPDRARKKKGAKSEALSFPFDSGQGRTVAEADEQRDHRQTGRSGGS